MVLSICLLLVNSRHLNSVSMLEGKVGCYSLLINFVILFQEYKVYAYFRQFWTDSRLAGKLNRTMVLQERDIDRIWHPDPYCINARESNLMIPNDELNSFVKVNPSGEVSMSNG